MQAELIQASGKHKAKADESKDLAELTGTIYQLSKGVKSGGASDDLCDALEALHIDPGQQPSKRSVEAADTWFSLEYDHWRMIKRRPKRLRSTFKLTYSAIATKTV